jgi:sodium/pantothenate symporter
VPTTLNYTGLISLPSYLDPILIGAVVSLAVTIAVSRAGRVTRAETAYRMRLHRTPAEETDLGKTRLTLIAPAILVAYGCVMPFVMRHWYVEPYQRGAGKLLPDGSIDWATGEAILSISWPFIYVPLGLIVWRVVRSSYSPGARRTNASV